MKRFALALLLALAPACAQAQNAFEFQYDPGYGTGIYARIFKTGSTAVAVAGVEGTSQALGNYWVLNSAITGAGLPTAGKYSYKLFIGAASPTAYDEQIGNGVLYWDGTAAYDPATVASASALPTVTVSAPPISYVPKTSSKKTRFSFVVTDSEGALVDPTSNTINLAYVDPDGGSVPSGLPTTATRISTGRYYFDITVLSTFSLQQKLVITATATVSSVAKTLVFNTQFMATPPAQIIVQ